MQLNARQLSQQAIVSQIAQSQMREVVPIESTLMGRYVGHDSKGYKFATENSGIIYATILGNTEPVKGESYQMQRTSGSDVLTVTVPSRSNTNLSNPARQSINFDITITEGDPRETATLVNAKHPYELLYDKLNRVLYYWQPAITPNPAQWTPFLQVSITTTTPTAPGLYNGALSLQIPATGSPKLFTWRVATNTWEQIGGGSGPRIETFSPTTETGAAGDQWINSTIGRTWIYNGTIWIPQNRGYHGATVPTGVIEGDTWLYEVGGYWYIAVYTGAAWQKASYCSPPGCANDPPEPPSNLVVAVAAYMIPPGGSTCTYYPLPVPTTPTDPGTITLDCGRYTNLPFDDYFYGRLNYIEASSNTPQTIEFYFRNVNEFNPEPPNPIACAPFWSET